MKKENAKKIFAAISILAVLMCTGCGAKKAVTEADKNDEKIASTIKANLEAGKPFAEKGTTLEIGVGSSPNVKDFETNKFTLYLEEKTGLDLKFAVYSEGQEKIKLMLAADDPKIPEALMGYNFGDDILTKYGQDGEQIFVDLTDYMDKYSVYLKKAISNENEIAKNPETAFKSIDIEKYLKSADGKKYFMPYITKQEGNVYSGKAWINKKWLDKLGLSVPKTTEELKTTLKAFVTGDPNGNGKKDEVGFTGAKDGFRQNPFHFLINSFIYDDQNNYYVVDKNGKLSLAYQQPEFKEALKYINSLAKEGLYDVEAFSQDNATLKQIAQRPDNIIGVYTSASPDNVFSANPERMLDYVALPNLTGPKGVALALTQPRDARCNGLITKNCHNPLAAFGLMDFMLSEDASLYARYGEKGVDWKEATSSDIPLFKNIGMSARVVPILGYGTPQNSHWQAANPQYRFSEIADGMAWNGIKTDGEKVKADAITAYYGKGPEKIVSKQLFTQEENEEYSDIKSSLSTFISQNIADFITGTRNIDKEWDAFQTELKSYNVQKFLELSQKGYDRFEGKIK